MIRRYNLSHPVGQPMPEDWIHLPDSVVAAADYDAISARLAEAERLLHKCTDGCGPYVLGADTWVEITQFLGAVEGAGQ
jgi:hypothetical protein